MCCGVVVAVNLFAVVLVEQDSQHEISADIPGTQIFNLIIPLNYIK